MKRGLLISRVLEGNEKNIGDYIQSLAQKQFIETVDCFVDREHLSEFKEENGVKVKTVMNSWFMWRPESFPPSEEIIPLYLSFHITPTIEKKLFTRESISHFKKHEPIGCRDLSTVALMKKYGIQAYFSGCLTLTLGKSYKKRKTSDEVIFIDPYYQIRKPCENRIIHILHTLFVVLSNLHIAIFIKNFPIRYYTNYSKLSLRLNRLINICYFCAEYRTKFEIALLKNAKYQSNIVDVRGKNDNQILKLAEEVVNRIADAQLVVTSRIHAALPAIAVGTPCIFTTSPTTEFQFNSFGTPDRMEGLKDFLRIYTINDYKMSTDDVILNENEKIGLRTFLTNKMNWIPFAKKMAEQVSDFFKDET